MSPFETILGKDTPNFQKAAAILEAGRANIERSELIPCAFIFKGDSLTPILTPFRTGAEKETAAQAIREACVGADLLIYLHEAWVLSATEEEYAAYRRGSLEHHPRRAEAMIVLVETPETSATGIGRLDGAIPNRRVANFVWRRTEDGGLFVNLLCLPRGVVQ